MRAAFSKALVDLAKADPSVVLLTGDHGYALFDEFRRVCPAQYINAGIAEQNMVGMAAGLARTGLVAGRLDLRRPLGELHLVRALAQFVQLPAQAMAVGDHGVVDGFQQLPDGGVLVSHEVFRGGRWALPGLIGFG